jgi:hypothetical protein
MLALAASSMDVVPHTRPALANIPGSVIAHNHRRFDFSIQRSIWPLHGAALGGVIADASPDIAHRINRSLLGVR